MVAHTVNCPPGWRDRLLIAPDVVFLENMTSDLYVGHEADVYRYGMAFDRLRALALPP